MADGVSRSELRRALRRYLQGGPLDRRTLRVVLRVQQAARADPPTAADDSLFAEALGVFEKTAPDLARRLEQGLPLLDGEEPS